MPSVEIVIGTLTITTLWDNSVDAKLTIFFFFFPQNRPWHFMQIVSLGKERKNKLGVLIGWTETVCLYAPWCTYTWGKMCMLSVYYLAVHLHNVWLLSNVSVNREAPYSPCVDV